MVVALGSTWLLGCDAADEQNQSSAGIWCTALCERVRTCHVVDPGCKADCVADRPGLGNVSPAGAHAVAPCLEVMSCQALSSSAVWDREMDRCWDEAHALVEPTVTVRNLCRNLVETWFGCGYLFALEDCESIYGMWSDGVLQDVASCLPQANCEELTSCIDAVFEEL